MKKKTVILAASVVVILALLAVMFFLLARNASPSADANTLPTNTTVEAPIKEPMVNPPAEKPKSEPPDGEPEPGETPPVEDPAENPGTGTPPVNENGKIPIGSPAILTDETTGKGVVSLGDHVDQVRENLSKYEPSEGLTEISNYYESEYGKGFDLGNVGYRFNADGYLVSYRYYVGNCDNPDSVVTSKGLKAGDPLSKVFELYGRDYTFTDSTGIPPIATYEYSYGDNFMFVEVQGDTWGEPVAEGEDIVPSVIIVGLKEYRADILLTYLHKE